MRITPELEPFIPCRNADADPEMWFPERRSMADSPEYAGALCSGCPVKPECLATALALRVAHGIWGGTTGREREAMLRRRYRAAAARVAAELEPAP